MPVSLITIISLIWVLLVGGLTTTFIGSGHTTSQSDSSVVSFLKPATFNADILSEGVGAIVSQGSNSTISPDFIAQANGIRSRLQDTITNPPTYTTPVIDAGTVAPSRSGIQSEVVSNTQRSVAVQAPASSVSSATTFARKVLLVDPASVKPKVVDTTTQIKKNVATTTDIVPPLDKPMVPDTSIPNMPKSSTGYTLANVATHNTSSDCWIVVSGNIYSVASYISMHPGGRTAIINQCGTDATTAFTTKGGIGAHSSTAWSTLGTFLVGSITVPLGSYSLSINISGTGSGNVTCSPTSCSSYTKGTLVTLTASASSGSTFSGWTGACSGTGSCTVTMNQATTVGAMFTADPIVPVVVPTSPSSGYTLANVATHNTSSDCWIVVSGNIYSVASYISMHPGGRTAIINQCGTDATTAFTTKGGIGAHSSTAWSLLNTFLIGTIAVTTTPTTPGVETFTLTTTLSGTGSGMITSSPYGINCGQTCTATFVKGTVVTLTQTPLSGATFSGWSGYCSGTGACTITMNQNTTGGASFTAVQAPVSQSGYTTTEVAAHNSSADCWIIVSGKVYSVASYISLHPGGRTRIINQCGKDATTPFQTRGGSGSHSASAWSILNTFLIGIISVATTPTTPTTPTPPTTPTTPTSTTTTTTPTTPTTPTTTYQAVSGVVPPSILQLYPSATIKQQDIGSNGSQELEVNTSSGCRHIKVNSSGTITSNSKC